jgi:hypothetical protein
VEGIEGEVWGETNDVHGIIAGKVGECCDEIFDDTLETDADEFGVYRCDVYKDGALVSASKLILLIVGCTTSGVLIACGIPKIGRPG